MRVVLAGEESAGIRVLQRLSKGTHEIVGVLAKPADEQASSSNLWTVAQRMGHRCWAAENVRSPDFASELAAFRPDVMLNVHSLYIVHPSILEVPKYGAYNLHPGPLPNYAGLNAPSWAIFHGEATHGVTLHRMDAGIDTGPIIFQEMFELAPDDTALKVSVKCILMGVGLIVRLLDQLSRDPEGLVELRTSSTEISYFSRDVPHEGMLSWSWPAARIVRFTRACDYYPFPSPWGSPQADLDGSPLGIVKATTLDHTTMSPPGTVGTASEGSIPIACGEGTVAVSLVHWKDRFEAASDVLTAGMVLGDGRPTRNREQISP